MCSDDTAVNGQSTPLRYPEARGRRRRANSPRAGDRTPQAQGRRHRGRPRSRILSRSVRVRGPGPKVGRARYSAAVRTCRSSLELFVDLVDPRDQKGPQAGLQQAAFAMRPDGQQIGDVMEAHPDPLRPVRRTPTLRGLTRRTPDSRSALDGQETRAQPARRTAQSTAPRPLALPAQRLEDSA